MSLRAKTCFVCQSCGYWSPRWMGRCPECQEWGSLVEEWEEHRSLREKPPGSKAEPRPITQVDLKPSFYFPTGLKELDRVLGGGIVPSSLILIGGDPGIGKSTLLLQACASLAASGETVLYVLGEESLEQARSRGERLRALHANLLLLAETNLQAILVQVDEVRPTLLVLDSIQTTYSDELQSPPGSIGQVREVAMRLLRFVKDRSVSAILIGHVTKDGILAGPKALEHIVDAVISFEGERQHVYRILRAFKNRFGSTEEIGVFEMTEQGLVEVSNPSELFLSERLKEASGSMVVPIVEGTRPILVELQALVTSTGAPMPRRVCNGLDYHRAALLLAIMEKRLGLPLGVCDVYLNVAGGVKVTETAADLALVAAVISSFQNQPLDASTVIFGEVGLGGEVRAVRQVERRLQEAVHLGFTRCLLPQSNFQRLRGSFSLELASLRSLEEFMGVLFLKR